MFGRLLIWHFGAPKKVTPHKLCNSKFLYSICLLYTSDAADEEDSVDLGGRRIIKKKKKEKNKDEENKENAKQRKVL